jgi:uncharacterized tellurite resistance protein B-like protein
MAELKKGTESTDSRFLEVHENPVSGRWNRAEITVAPALPSWVTWRQLASADRGRRSSGVSMSEDKIVPRYEGSTLVIETSGETETNDPQFLVAALLVYVAKGDGSISPSETEEMLQAIGRHFKLQSSQSLELLNRAVSSLADNPDLEGLLRRLSRILSPNDKREIALMMLKVAAADGRKDATEMEKLHIAAEIIDIPPDVLHQAFDDYFAETMA